MRPFVAAIENHDKEGFIMGVPHQVILSPPPQPPPALQHYPPASREQSCDPYIFCSRKPPTPHYRDVDHLSGVIRKFSRDLRRRHRTKVYWPIELIEHVGSRSEQLYKYHTDVLVAPVLDLISQLRAFYIKDPLRLVSRNPEDGVSVITVTSISPAIPYAPSFSASAPVMIFVPSGTGVLDKNDGCSRLLAKYLRDAWEIDASAKVLCSDLQDLYIFHKDPTSPHNVSYEHVSVASSLVAIRVVIAAYVYAALPTGLFESLYLAFPQGTKAWDPPTPLGCLPDPSTPMPTDEEVFTMYKRRSDFDLYTLMNVSRRALQALRWQDHVFKKAHQASRLQSGDELFAATNGFSRSNTTLRPYWPVDLDAIPDSVFEHIKTIKRSPPLDHATRLRLSESTQFRLRITEKLGRERAAVYRCELVSIDDSPIPYSVPTLCVKLFDDRLIDVHAPSDPGDNAVVSDASWWRFWLTGEDQTRQEHAVYEQLAFSQGATIPWYLGAHKFVLPDGHWVYGVLLEYISDGLKLSEAIPEFDDTERGALVRSARHAVRVLQYGDVSQHDWHKEQVLVCRSPVPHMVLVDFAATSLSTEPENHEVDDYGNMLRILAELLRNAGMTVGCIMEHYGGPEECDLMASSFWKDDSGKEWVLRADPFAWIFHS